MTIQAKLETLRKLLEDKMEKCPSCHGTGQGEVDTDQGHGHSAAVGCGECGGTGYIPYPVYAPLLEVVRERCPCSLATDLKEGYLPYEEHPLLCKRCWLRGIHTSDCDCRGKGFVTRSWVELPKGALVGALFVASLSLPSSVETHGAAFEPDLLFQGDDSDDAALDILIEALGGEPPCH